MSDPHGSFDDDGIVCEFDYSQPIGAIHHQTIRKNARDEEKTSLTSPDQVAIYTTEDGKAHVRLQLKDNDAWLNTNQMAELFDVGAPAINHHIREDSEKENSTKLNVKNFYNSLVRTGKPSTTTWI